MNAVLERFSHHSALVRRFNTWQSHIMRFIILMFALIPLALLVLSSVPSVHPVADSLAVFRLQLGVVSILSVIALRSFIGGRYTFMAAALSGAAIVPIVLAGQNAQDVTGDAVFGFYQKNLSFRLGDPLPLINDIRLQKPAVLSLQEVTSRNKEVLTALKPILPTQLWCPFASVGGVAIASRWPAIKGTETCFANLGAAALQVQSPAGAVWLISIHLHWPYPFGQAQQFKNLMAKIETLEGPKLIGGDLNMVAWSGVVSELERSTQTTRQGAVQGTFILKSVINLPIDHILVPSNCTSQIKTRPFLGSDHRGLIGKFQWDVCATS